MKLKPPIDEKLRNAEEINIPPAKRQEILNELSIVKGNMIKYLN